MPRADEIPRRLLVAIGGNAIHPENIRGTSAEQKAIAETTAQALLPLAQIDNELVITHGHGPVVGKILMRQALTQDRRRDSLPRGRRRAGHRWPPGSGHGRAQG